MLICKPYWHAHICKLHGHAVLLTTLTCRFANHTDMHNCKPHWHAQLQTTLTCSFCKPHILNLQTTLTCTLTNHTDTFNCKPHWHAHFANHTDMFNCKLHWHSHLQTTLTCSIANHTDMFSCKPHWHVQLQTTLTCSVANHTMQSLSPSSLDCHVVYCQVCACSVQLEQGVTAWPWRRLDGSVVYFCKRSCCLKSRPLVRKNRTLGP